MKRIALLLMTMFFMLGGSVFSADNVALNKSASQSSTFKAYQASIAVDGETEGEVSHTNNDFQAWYQVDLGSIYNIDKIKIYPRGLDANRVADCYILVSNKNLSYIEGDVEKIAKNEAVTALYISQAGTVLDISEKLTGRYVRLQLKGTNYLILHEFEVWTNSTSPSDGCSEIELDAKYEAGKEDGYDEGQQACKADPASCGISTDGGYTQADIDIKYQKGYNDGCTACADGTATPATISPELKMHIPVLRYVSPFGTIDLWTDFEFAGEKNGDMLWKLSNFGQK